MTTSIEARDRAEEVAIFRHGIIGALATRDGLTHGELAEALRRIAEECHRPPEAERTRHFSVATLERWLYAYKKGGLVVKEDYSSDAELAKWIVEQLKK